MGLEPADDRTPDKAFDQRWAAALLNEVLTALESDYRREGKAALFDALRQTLVGIRESQRRFVMPSNTPTTRASSIATSNRRISCSTAGAA